MSDQCQVGKPCATKVEAGDCCCDMPEKLLGLAEEAWMELLKDKIKAEMSQSCGADLDKLAKLVAETSKAKWEHMVQGKVKCEEYKNKLKNLMTS